jgi:alpha-tubulin suppressor-like RCC1 family protein
VLPRARSQPNDPAAGSSRRLERALSLAPIALVAVALGALALPAAAPARKVPPRVRIFAGVSAARLAPIQARQVVLRYRLSRPTGRVLIRLDRKHGSRWAKIRRVRTTGRFKGTRSVTMKRLFARKELRVGSYRVRLSTEKRRASLRFSIFKAVPLKGARAIGAGGTLTCALVGSGDGKCWGYNKDGELGNGRTMNSRTPVEVAGVSGATAVASGYKHACVVLAGGSVSCWGYNKSGALGNGTNTSSSRPVAVTGIGNTVSQSSGGGHSCAVVAGGTLYCWGDNEVGQLGTGERSLYAPFGIFAPVKVTLVSNVVSVSAGFLHTCVLVSGGTIECWGYNNDGQVGDGSRDRYRPHAHPAPALVKGITDAVQISAGAFHNCALLSSGHVECWGYIVSSDYSRALLDTPVPEVVPGISHAISISSGGFVTCALIADGTVKCWGENEFGQLGNGKWKDSTRPVPAVGINNAVSISSGGLHNCAVLAGGSVRCWGGNEHGELGTGSRTASSIPITVVRPTPR